MKSLNDDNDVAETLIADNGTPVAENGITDGNGDNFNRCSWKLKCNNFNICDISFPKSKP